MKKKVFVVIMLICVSFLFGCANTGKKENTESTLPGADEIYPTVLVDGECYQWRMGSAIMNLDVVNNSTYDSSLI